MKETLKTKKALLSDKEKEISRLRQEIQEKDGLLKKKQELLEKKDKHISHLEEKLLSSAQLVRQLKKELQV